MSASLNNLETISALSTGEVFLTASGGRAFEMLSAHIDRLYRSLDFSKIFFLDNFVLYDKFVVSSKISGAPERFYLIDVQNVQKNISSTREALFEKNFCDMAHVKTEKIKMPLLLSEIISGFQKFYSELDIAAEIKIFTSETNENKKSLFLTASEIFKSLNLKYEEKNSFELDDFLEIKFYLPDGEHGPLSAGFIACDYGRILFSLTGGIEKIIKEKARHGSFKLPFIINPFQLVVLTDRIDKKNNIYAVLESYEKRGHSVVWQCLGGRGEASDDSFFDPHVKNYKNAGAHAILVLPDFNDSSKVFLYRGANQKICGMDFFQLNSIYLQKDFKGCE
jgi:hypothetical protein